jgi:hypothetical protein
LKDKRIALYDPKGKALVAQDLAMKSLRGMMHSVARSSLYFLRDSHNNSLHSLQLLRWNYVDNSVKVSHIALETRFKKGLFSSAYGVPPNARPISGR